MSMKTRRIVFFSIIILVIAGIVFLILKLALPNKTDIHHNNDSSSVDNDENYYSIPDIENVVTDEETGEKYANNEILLSAVESSNYSEIEKLAQSYDAEIVGYIKAFDEYQIRFSNSFSRADLLEYVEKLESSELIEYASLDYGINISEDGYYTPDDPWGGNQNWDSTAPEGNNWGVEAINAPQAWDHRDEMSEITIGLIDSGYEDHEDLSFSWRRDYGTNDHGCHVAGTMAADFDNNKGISGVIPTKKSNGDNLVNLLGITFNDNDLCYIVEYKSAFAELILRNTKVINISQGVHWSETEESEGYWKNNDITDKAREEITALSKPMEVFLSRCLNRNYDFIIVCAAGNNGGIDAKYNSPLTAIENDDVSKHIIVVGALKNLGREFNLFGGGKHKGYAMRSTSDLGQRVDIVAPGEKIYSCLSNNRYGNMSGTSMAAPHASGVAAMVWSLNPTLTGEEVKRIIVDTADRPVEKNGISYNILNAENAVNTVLGIEDNTPSDNTHNVNYGSIIGKVVDKNTDEFIANATVKAYSMSGDYIDSAVTDDYGQYELLLEEGKYNLTVSASNYNDSSLDNITVETEQVNYIEWIYLSKKEKPSSVPTEPPAKSTAGTEFLLGDWSTSDGVNLSFYDDNSFILEWGYFPAEEGSWHAEAISNDIYNIKMDGSSILSMMSLLYGSTMSDYHFEILKCNNDNFYLVQVYDDYTAKTSPCKLGFTRNGATKNFNTP